MRKKKRVSPSWAPVTGADLLGGLQNPPGSSPGRDSSVAPTTVCLFTETLRKRNEAPRLYRRKQTTTHQRTTRQETMLAVIQTLKGVEKHIDTHTLADNTELGGGTP